MEFEWDEEKARINFDKHGVRFEDAIYIFENQTIERQDTRRDYGEVRIEAYGILDGRVLTVIYTDRVHA